MKTLGGIDLAKLKAHEEMNTPYNQPKCPGALLRLTRQDKSTYERNGERFAWDDFKPEQLYGDARVRCANPTHAWKGCAGYIVYAGRCTSCERLERDHRDVLRARQAPEPAKGRREAAE